MNCRAYVRYDHMRKDNYNKTIYFHSDRNYNPFARLLGYNTECYKCNNFGHKSRDCRSLIESPMEENTLNGHKER